MRIRTSLIVVLLLAVPLTAPPQSLGDSEHPFPHPITGWDSSRADESVTFVNVSETAGLPMIDSGHATFAWGDYNNDDHIDLLVDTVHGPLLYENNGPPSWDFTNVTAAVGLSGPGMSNSLWGDIDNDGNLDLYTTWWDESIPSTWDVLWRNSGPPGYTFSNVTLSAGNITDIYPGKGNVWADVDRDGYLDMYVVNWRTGSSPLYKDYFWHNNGNQTFTDLSEEAGIYDTDPDAYRNPPFAGMGITSGDYNNDGWMDIYVSNYLITPNYLWENQRNLTFENVAAERNAAGHNKDGYYGHSAGSAMGDYNNDGFMDIWVSDLAHKDPQRADLCDDSLLLENQGPPLWNFTDVRGSTGIPTIPKGTTEGMYYKDEHHFSANWADMDNDGDIDLFVPQVKNMAWSQTYLWRNDGDGTFTNITDSTGVKTYDSINGAWGDYDNDGFMDIVVDGKYPFTNGTRQVRLFRNGGNSNHWVKFNLTGTENNAPAIGTRVKVTVGDEVQIREVEGGSGSHGSQNSLKVHFGLGSTTTVDEVEIRWPNGNVQLMTDLAADQQYDVVETSPPVSIDSISADAQVVEEDDDVTITASVSGSPSTYEWDLDGDGQWDTVSGTTQVSHVYTERGVYYPALRVLDAGGALGVFQSARVVVENAVPTPRLDHDAPVYEDEVLHLDASGSSDTVSDQSSLEFNISFGDGQHSGWSSNTSWEHVYLINMTYSGTLMVRDDDGSVGELPFEVPVMNALPKGSTDRAVMALEDHPVSFSGSANDTVSDVTAGLEYRWTFGDGGSTEWSPEPGAEHTYSEAGAYNATFRVRDDDGGEDMVPVNVTVVGVGPEAIIDEAPAVVNEDQLMELDGHAIDTVSDDTHTFMWDFGDGNSTQWSASSPVSHIYETSGTFLVTFRVKDDDGLMGTDTVNVTVLNMLPSVSLVEYPAEIAEDENGTFVASGYDTPSDIGALEYRWDFGDGNTSGWIVSAETTHTYSGSGMMDLILEVRDDDGETMRVEETVVVTNPEPGCEVQVPEDTVEEDQELHLAAVCTDNPSDRDGLVLWWDVDGEGFSGKELNLTFSRSGQRDVVFTATDDDGSLYRKEISIRVRNRAPSVSDLDAPTQVSVGETAHFNVTISDTGSDMPLLEVEWSFGDRKTATGASVDHVYSKPGYRTVRVTVTDDDGASASRTATVRVTGGEEDGGDGAEEMDWTPLVVGAGGFLALGVVLLLLYLFIIAPRRKDHGGLDDTDTGPGEVDDIPLSGEGTDGIGPEEE